MRLGAIVLDSSDPDKLSEFYKNLLGWSKTIQHFEGDTWYILYDEKGAGTPMVFQLQENYHRPTWPPQHDAQQQMLHLDFYVGHDEQDVEVERALSIGASLAEQQLSDSWRVLLDPAGHPFCIIPIPKQHEK